MLNRIKRVLALALITLAGPVLAWTEIPRTSEVSAAKKAVTTIFRNISPEETDVILRGEPLIRTIRGAIALGLAPGSTAADEVRKKITDMKPNFITELMLVIDVGVTTSGESRGASSLNRLAAVLADVERYMKIPYWSKKNRTTYDLFDKMDIRSRTEAQGGETIGVLQHMEPFDDFRATYRYRLEGGELRFSAINDDPIVYSYLKYSAVARGGMIWDIYASVRGSMLFVYGVGAVRAFDMLGIVSDRLEPSFMGRVEAFFLYISGKAKL